jgi:hypothetical protein
MSGDRARDQELKNQIFKFSVGAGQFQETGKCESVRVRGAKKPDFCEPSSHTVRGAKKPRFL